MSKHAFAGLRFAPSLLAVVSAYGAVSPRAADAADYTFCMRYPTERHYDASPTSDNTDFEEDYGRNGGTWKLRHMSAQVVAVTGGSTKFNGQLDSNGCTTQFTSTSDKFHIYYTARYLNDGTGVDFKVFDCPAGTNCTFPLYIMSNYDPASTSGTYYPELAPAYVMDIYVAAAGVVDRFLADYYQNASPKHYFEFWSTGNESEGGFTSTAWNDTSNYPIMRFSSVSARSKFEIAHESGHGVMLDLVDDDYLYNCAFGSGGAENHTMIGREYQSCASSEGFGHFVSAVTWNDISADDATGVFVDFAEVGSMTPYNVENYSKKILDYCTNCTSYGVELDWLRFLWDYRTDGGSTKPLIDDILDVILVAEPWHSGLGHYEDWYDAVDVTLGATQASRFAAKAAFNGTDW